MTHGAEVFYDRFHPEYTELRSIPLDSQIWVSLLELQPNQHQLNWFNFSAVGAAASVAPFTNMVQLKSQLMVSFY